MNETPRRLTLNLFGPEPHPEPNHFLRTRLKSGPRWYLVATVRRVKRRDPAAAVRLAITMYRVDLETFNKREPDQVVHWFRWYPRNPKTK